MVEGENEDKDAHPTSPAENEFLIFLMWRQDVHHLFHWRP